MSGPAGPGVWPASGVTDEGYLKRRQAFRPQLLTPHSSFLTISLPGLQQCHACLLADLPGIAVPVGGLYLADVRLVQQQHAQAALSDAAAHGEGQLAVQQHLVEGQRPALIGVGGLQLRVQGRGRNADAVRYEAELRDAAEAAGVILRRYILPADTEQTDIEGLIRQINADSLLSALLLVQPLPARMDAAALRTQIDPKKAMDADTCELLLQHVIDAAERNARP